MIDSPIAFAIFLMASATFVIMLILSVNVESTVFSTVCVWIMLVSIFIAAIFRPRYPK